MDTRTLRYFQTVAEFGGYSRAAEFLRLTQPALSRQIKSLETELGTTLFHRHGHGITLTDPGRTLLARARAILRTLDQTREEIRAGAGEISGTVNLAVPPAAGTWLIPPLMKRLAATCPNVSVKIVGGYSGYIHEWLVRGAVDLACWHDPLPQKGFAVTPLVREPVFVVGRTGHFPRPGAVKVSDLPRLPAHPPQPPQRLPPPARFLDGAAPPHPQSPHGGGRPLHHPRPAPRRRGLQHPHPRLRRNRVAPQRTRSPPAPPRRKLAARPRRAGARRQAPGGERRRRRNRCRRN